MTAPSTPIPACPRPCPCPPGRPPPPQVHASADSLKLITFDADGTLYADGAHIEQDSEMIRLIVSLMRLKVHVSIVTAAGYPVRRFARSWLG